MRTIFITILQGVEAKNLLRTTVVKTLLERGGQDLRVVLFVRTPERAEYYRREFFDSRLVYEVLESAPAGFWERIFSALKFLMLRTETTDLRRRMKFDQDRNFAAFAGGWLLNRLVARLAVRHVIRWLDFRLVHGRPYAPFFSRYRPDLIFLAHLFDDAEIELLREARRSGVRTVGFVNSWDKLTARSSIRLLPDELLVYSEIVKAEAIAHADVAPERIHVVGIPQYDLYAGYEPRPRADFLKAAGLNVAGRFVLYAPMGETFSDFDWDIIDLLHRWVGDGTLPVGVELLVRFQPNDRFDETKIASRPWLRYDRPGKRFTAERGVDWDMTAAEVRHLADTLAHCSLLVCYASSISVDAAIFGKPVINIDFEIRPPRFLAKSPTQFYQMEHYRKALATGGMRLVRSERELLQWAKRYLEDPLVDSAGRARLVSAQCGVLDGHAGERIADMMLAE